MEALHRRHVRVEVAHHAVLAIERRAEIAGVEDLRDRIRMAGQGFDEEQSLLEIGDEYEAEGYSLTLTEARFAQPEVPATDGQDTPPAGTTTPLSRSAASLML